MMHRVKKLFQPLLWSIYTWYLSKPRWYHYQGLEIRVLPSVFHPGLLLSTKSLAQFVSTLNLKEKSILELGAGSGLISLIAARKGSHVVATDINHAALESIRQSMKVNSLELNLIESDLFEEIPLQKFDYIFINPPFYPKAPKELREFAFYCGENFSFYQGLFKGIYAFIELGARPYMILSDNSDLKEIANIARQNNLRMSVVQVQKKMLENLFIYELMIGKNGMLR